MLIIDNCKYCAAVTHTNYKRLFDLLVDAEKGDAGCWLCGDSEDGDHHTEFDVYDSGKKVWCGHKQKCNDVVGQGR